jgi:hypothetical protein
VGNSIDSMTAGIALAGWFKKETRRIYAMLDESEDDGDARRLVEWVTRQGGRVTPRMVQASYRPLRATGAAKVALEQLVKKGVGVWEADPAPPRGGHQATYFRLA